MNKSDVHLHLDIKGLFWITRDIYGNTFSLRRFIWWKVLAWGFQFSPPFFLYLHTSLTATICFSSFNALKFLPPYFAYKKHSVSTEKIVYFHTTNSINKKIISGKTLQALSCQNFEPRIAIDSNRRVHKFKTRT